MLNKKVKKYVISIDENLCVGCGKCVKACLIGILAIVNGKAKLINKNFVTVLAHV